MIETTIIEGEEIKQCVLRMTSQEANWIAQALDLASHSPECEPELRGWYRAMAIIIRAQGHYVL